MPEALHDEDGFCLVLCTTATSSHCSKRSYCSILSLGICTRPMLFPGCGLAPGDLNGECRRVPVICLGAGARLGKIKRHCGITDHGGNKQHPKWQLLSPV